MVAMPCLLSSFYDLSLLVCRISLSADGLYIQLLRIAGCDSRNSCRPVFSKENDQQQVVLANASYIRHLALQARQGFEVGEQPRSGLRWVIRVRISAYNIFRSPSPGTGSAGCIRSPDMAHLQSPCGPQAGRCRSAPQKFRSPALILPGSAPRVKGRALH